VGKEGFIRQSPTLPPSPLLALRSGLDDFVGMPSFLAAGAEADWIVMPVGGELQLPYLASSPTYPSTRVQAATVRAAWSQLTCFRVRKLLAPPRPPPPPYLWPDGRHPAGMPRERTEEDGSVRRSAGRSTVTGKSSVSDVEFHRRADAPPGAMPAGAASLRGSISGGEDDDRASVFSDRDDSVRGKNVRKSILPGMDADLPGGHMVHTSSGLATGADLEDDEMAALMGYTTSKGRASGAAPAIDLGFGDDLLGLGAGVQREYHMGGFEHLDNHFPDEYVEPMAGASPLRGMLHHAN